MKIFNQSEIRDIWSTIDGFDPYPQIKIVGRVDEDLSFYMCKSSFDLVDISEAEFIEEDKEERVCYGFSHSGPVYGNRICVRHYDYLDMFVRDVMTDDIILPPYVKRRHINRLKDMASIGRVFVTDDCALFSMKDGDVYNKKGTILVYSNKK